MKIEVSIGEVMDKLSILAIKRKKITAPEKLANIEKEYQFLAAALAKEGIETDSSEYRRLEAVNAKLWDIEDKIRLKEAASEFDGQFIELARSVYFNNDDRANVKREINEKYGSELVEEKQYATYRFSKKMEG